MKYQKKKVYVEADPWFKDGDHPQVRKSSKEELIHYFKVLPKNWDQFGVIDTLEGVHVVTPGDFIIKGVKGEFYACKPEIFWLTYEKTLLGEILDLARNLHLQGKIGTKVYNSLISLPDSPSGLYQLGLKAIRFVLKSMV